MTKKAPTKGQRTLARLDRGRDEASLSEAEAREMLKEEGVDVETEYKLLLESLATRSEAERKQRLIDAENAYRALDFSSTKATARRSRSDNLNRIRVHQQLHPQLTASFRDLSHMSDADLQSLVDEVDELTGDGQKE